MILKIIYFVTVIFALFALLDSLSFASARCRKINSKKIQFLKDYNTSIHLYNSFFGMVASIIALIFIVAIPVINVIVGYVYLQDEFKDKLIDKTNNSYNTTFNKKLEENEELKALWYSYDKSNF